MIGYYMDSECVCCERCVNCGRKEKQPILEDLKCDKCESSEDVIYSLNGVHFCRDCLVKEVGAEEITEENFKEYL